MGSISPIWLLLPVAILMLNAYAMFRMLVSSFYAPRQLTYQVIMVFVLPVIGALLVIYMARNDTPPCQSSLANDPDQTLGAPVDLGLNEPGDD